MDFSVVIGGEAGQGAFSIELEATGILAELKYHFFATKNYMSRIRGGHNFHMIRIADHPVHALSGEPWSMIIALDEETERRHRPNLHESGIYLSRTMTQEIEKEARDVFRDVTGSNSILVGLILSVLGAPLERVVRAAEQGHRELLEKGHEFAIKWNVAGAFTIRPTAGIHCKLDGNQALALGALLGGCQFMAGYPMTPATSIMHHFAMAARSSPVHFEQAEDEISAINMALGASYAGVRSLVATSGGGFALMQEGVSLAGMTETPIVIMIAQRPGPATGLPTRTEQADLNFVLHSGHGEFPRIVFAPGSIQEAILLARDSFDLADRYQIPVFLLTDQYFADSVHVVEDRIPTQVMSRVYPIFDRTYRRYRLTEDGISPLSYPGLSEALIRVDSDEHDEEGKITEDLALRQRMVEKRLGKRELFSKTAVPPTLYGDSESESYVLCWGSNQLIVKEAVERLSGEGIRIAGLHFGQVYPLTAEMIRPYGLETRKLICVENNAEGQFAALLRRELRLDVAGSVLKFNGECFTVEELRHSLKGILG
ncbi:MAG: 2-oxoacid:acceptor oxidoreductase subunit alpha [Syntrophus sp. (in: bacteria)]|nr:2-oxoacid:acceptor oxidoreductase subunit alpha [Syntrophus sp. (in: bacteria)]